jgi:hypothetical protein
MLRRSVRGTVDFLKEIFLIERSWVVEECRDTCLSVGSDVWYVRQGGCGMWCWTLRWRE